MYINIIFVWGILGIEDVMTKTLPGMNLIQLSRSVTLVSVAFKELAKETANENKINDYCIGNVLRERNIAEIFVFTKNQFF